jgi:hypothetical protein
MLKSGFVIEPSMIYARGNTVKCMHVPCSLLLTSSHLSGPYTLLIAQGGSWFCPTCSLENPITPAYRHCRRLLCVGAYIDSNVEAADTPPGVESGFSEASISSEVRTDDNGGVVSGLFSSDSEEKPSDARAVEEGSASESNDEGEGGG